MKSGCGPNFLVIGAGRCGTTSLHDILRQHPEVFVPPDKSPNFFVADDPMPVWEGAVARSMRRHWVVDRESYLGLFEGSCDRPARGEVSPVYLQSMATAARIHDFDPGMRLIAVLRNPVDRAYSHFLGRQRDGIEPPGRFEDRTEVDLEGWEDGVVFGNVVAIGRYARFLRSYFDRFPSQQIKVLFFEDLQRDASAFVREVFEFLEVDCAFAAESVRLNRSGTVRNPLLRTVWTGSVKLRTRLRPFLGPGLRTAAGRIFLDSLDRKEIQPATRAGLVELYRGEIEELEAMVGRDLSHWLEV